MKLFWLFGFFFCLYCVQYQVLQFLGLLFLLLKLWNENFQNHTNTLSLLKVVDCRICGDPHSVLRFAFIEFADEGNIVSPSTEVPSPIVNLFFDVCKFYLF